jgi:hypothetical protein
MRQNHWIFQRIWTQLNQNNKNHPTRFPSSTIRNLEKQHHNINCNSIAQSRDLNASFVQTIDHRWSSLNHHPSRIQIPIAWIEWLDITSVNSFRNYVNWISISWKAIFRHIRSRFTSDNHSKW